MSDYLLYCFAQSGNAYRAALMLNLIGADWKPQWIDFFGAGVQRGADYREGVNEMGEVPVLVDGDKKLTQSGVIRLIWAQDRKISAAGRRPGIGIAALDHFRQPEDQRFSRAVRFLKNFAKPRRSSGDGILQARALGNLAIVNKRLENSPF